MPIVHLLMNISFFPARPDAWFFPSCVFCWRDLRRKRHHSLSAGVPILLRLLRAYYARCRPSDHLGGGCLRWSRRGGRHADYNVVKLPQSTFPGWRVVTRLAPSLQRAAADAHFMGWNGLKNRCCSHWNALADSSHFAFYALLMLLRECCIIRLLRTRLEEVGSSTITAVCIKSVVCRASWELDLSSAYAYR